MALPKLKKNSVSTTLSAEINSTATTIPVLDLAAFHDIDGNLITDGIVIGYDNAIETLAEEVRITGASATSGSGNLTGAVRGVYADGSVGAAKTHVIGSSIAVMFSTGVYEQIRNSVSVDPIGVEWDSSSNSPTLRRIDIDNNTISLDARYFNHHPTFAGRRRCVRNRSTGDITYGTNGRGDGLVLDGSAGDVLVEEPLYYYKFEKDGDLYRWWISAENTHGFEPHPYFNMRGDTANNTSALMYSGAYEAYLISAGNVGSASGQAVLVSTTAQNFENYALANLGAGGGITSFWGNASDILLMIIEYATWDMQTAIAPGRTAATNTTAVATGADSADTNINTSGTGRGTGTADQTPVVWRGKENLWGNTWQYLMGINISTDGGTVASAATSDGGAKTEITVSAAHNLVDGNVVVIAGTANYNGTHVIESASGSTFVIDVAYVSDQSGTYIALGSYRVTNRDGSGSNDAKLVENLTGTPAPYTYETGLGIIHAATSGARAYGYATALLSGAAAGAAFLPSAKGGSTSTYVCDGWYTSHEINRVLLAGGSWRSALLAGPGCRDAGSAVSLVHSAVGARLEFRPGA